MYTKSIKLPYLIVIVVSWLTITDINATPLIPAPTTIPATNVNPENQYLEMYNRMMHGFNQWLFSWLNPTTNTTDTLVPGPIKSGITNFMSNLVNEPLTIAASILEGDHANALNSVARFMINTTIGFGGILDAAHHLGYPSAYRDLGLAMCKYGVPAGPHIVVPLVGPRTLRDGSADVVLVNVIYLSVIASVFGATPNMTVIIGIILMETIGDLALLRQIDSPEMHEMNTSYEVMRDQYLHTRTVKCREINDQVNIINP